MSYSNEWLIVYSLIKTLLPLSMAVYMLEKQPVNIPNATSVKARDLKF